MKEYDHKKIEKKWQTFWNKKKVYKTLNNSKKKKYYVLDMFPYPSGTGLHVGHPKGYIGSDVFARMKRMQGFNVLHPMGYDAFGLPAEQYAIEHNINPKQAVEKNVKTFEKQLSIIGLSYDWDRRVNTTDPDFYHFTQWIFLKIYDSWYNKETDKAEPINNLIKVFEKFGNLKVDAVSSEVEKFSADEWKKKTKKEKQDILMKYRLAYEGHSEVNWCPKLGTVLANDEIVDSKDGLVSERGNYPVVKKNMRQWFMRITAYADRLLSGLEVLDWSSHIKEIQKNWIGKSKGAEIEFKIVSPSPGDGEKIKVFTTRPDTIFGATYMVLAPEHKLVQKLKPQIKNWSEVEKYIKDIKNKTDIERTAEDKIKTGVELKGVKVINPATKEEIPVWIADYVLANYGTGAIMAVPAHDERDFEFAKKYKLEIKYVIAKYLPEQKYPTREGKKVVARKVVECYVRNPKNDSFLFIESKGADWRSPVCGGIEEGEDIQEAGRREIYEETGYKNFKFIKYLGSPLRADFFHPQKDENRQAEFNGVFFELENEEHDEVSPDELSKQTPVWIQRNKVTSFLTILPTLFNRINENNLYYIEEGVLINSGKFNGMDSEKAKKEIIKFVGGKEKTTFKMRDAIFARQRYWGEPIPLIYDKDGIIHELSEKDLPLKLPPVKSYQPTGTGESTLASVSTWVKKGYETNTMPGWAGSSWYFLRYMDPKNKKFFADKKAIQYWRDVDLYVGGAEHATGHLLYSRFWNKFLKDYDLVVTEEPFKKLRNQGMIFGADNRKMSKRWGNVINPDDIVKTYGADTLRIYEMFMGPFEQAASWNTDSIIGPRRFLERIWKIGQKLEKKSSSSVEKLLQKSIKKVSEDIEEMRFNTAVSTMMILVNEMDKGEIGKEDFKKFLQILSPFAPHVTEELWNVLGEKKSINISQWPEYDTNLLQDEEVKIAIQINGKVRAEMMINVDEDEETVKKKVFIDEVVLRHISGKEIKKVIYVKNRLINIVV